MRIMAVSSTGLILGLAMRCEGDGHDTKYLTTTVAGQGLVPNYVASENWRPDVVIFDSKEQITEAEQCRNDGIKVLGPTRWSSMVDSDPVYQLQIITSLGWATEGVTNGTNFYVTAWFNGNNFIASYASIVYRRFMPGGAGPDLSCTGMIADFRGLTPMTMERILKPLEKMLKRVNHRGCIHVHVLADGNNFVVKGLSTALAHPLSLLLYENTYLSASEVLLRLLDETSKPIRIADKWAAGLQVSTPPYPYGVGNDTHREVEGIVDANLKHLWLADVFKSDGKYKTRGLIGYITSRGPSDPSNNVENVECIRRMYRTVKNLKAADMQYRNDIGRNVQRLFHALRQPGWLE